MTQLAGKEACMQVQVGQILAYWAAVFRNQEHGGLEGGLVNADRIFFFFYLALLAYAVRHEMNWVAGSVLKSTLHLTLLCISRITNATVPACRLPPCLPTCLPAYSP